MASPKYVNLLLFSWKTFIDRWFRAI